MKALLILAILIPCSLFAVSISAVVTIIVIGKRNKDKADSQVEEEIDQQVETISSEQITTEVEEPIVPLEESDLL